jgi:hypothetical protein
VGLAITASPTVEDKLVLGSQVYDSAPDASKITAFPEQMDLFDVTVNALPPSIVTVTFAVFEHPLASVPLTVYVVVALTVGL